MAPHPRSLTRAVALGAAVGLAAAAVVLLLLRTGPATPEHSWPVPGEDGRRVLVEVLNGSGVDGLARAVTRHLRRAGFDVVFFGTAPATAPATVLYVRRGDSTHAMAVRRALGGGDIVVAPDPRPLLDVSVILGPDAAAFVRDP